ncbi:uncharacterized protein HD556DRAFT_1307961 [Suillus plorans]|uniref:Uncharacterized protein n=1 Tax=Suillus plorans TaxID=116603 RepID=A0A9P7DHI2_9AGAM|nr:uncharacterized protein HD556DRAFT_1307961 [Suillus plorans]KAG1794597.1 hypothetical protein HD556DRAFT_1307961 [Suillus plorans]
MTYFGFDTHNMLCKVDIFASIALEQDESVPLQHTSPQQSINICFSVISTQNENSGKCWVLQNIDSAMLSTSSPDPGNHRVLVEFDQFLAFLLLCKLGGYQTRPQSGGTSGENRAHLVHWIFWSDRMKYLIPNSIATLSRPSIQNLLKDFISLLSLSEKEDWIKIRCDESQEMMGLGGGVAVCASGSEILMRGSIKTLKFGSLACYRLKIYHLVIYKWR